MEYPWTSPSNHSEPYTYTAVLICVLPEDAAEVIVGGPLRKGLSGGQQHLGDVALSSVEVRSESMAVVKQPLGVDGIQKSGINSPVEVGDVEITLFTLGFMTIQGGCFGFPNHQQYEWGWSLNWKSVGGCPYFVSTKLSEILQIHPFGSERALLEISWALEGYPDTPAGAWKGAKEFGVPKIPS